MGDSGAAGSGERGRGPRRWIVALGAVLLVVATVVVTLTVVGGGDSSAVPVTLEPAATVGGDPFTDSLATGAAVSLPGSVQRASADLRAGLATDPATGTKVAVGTKAGLYGGSGDTRVCDPDTLVRFLDENRDKASAWARVLGIAVRDIGEYVATLTPVVLTNDTLLTNYGFRDGAATPRQSVLQAGTAVLVDRTGTPRVKCNCGNPLTPPARQSLPSGHVGAAWPGYSSGAVTTVRPGPSTSTLTLIHVETGTTYTAPTGSGAGGQWVAAKVSTLPGTQTTIVTSANGRSWTEAGSIPGEAVAGLAWGDGKWIAVSGASGALPRYRILESTDLRTWTPVHSDIGGLAAVAYGGGRWVAVGEARAGVAVGGTDHATRILLTSTDGRKWDEVDVQDASQAPIRRLVSVAYRGGTWLAIGIDETGDTGTLVAVTSKDGTQWAPTGTRMQVGPATAAVAADASTWVLLTDGTIAAPASTSRDARTWNEVSPRPFGPTGTTSIAHGARSWLATRGPEIYHSAPPEQTTIYSSDNGTGWSEAGRVDGAFTVVAWGVTAPSRGTTTTTTTTTTSTTATTGAAGGAPCTDVAVRAAVLGDPRYGGYRYYGGLRCSGSWALATVYEVDATGESTGDRTAIVEAQGGTWRVADPGSCAAGRVPAALYDQACRAG